MCAVMLQLVPPKLVPRTICGSYSWSPQTIYSIADGPPDQLWRRSWFPFATAGPLYNPTFLAFLLNHSYIKNSLMFFSGA